MRDGIDMREFAEHRHEWSKWLTAALRSVHRALHWAGAAFATDGFRRAG